MTENPEFTGLTDLFASRRYFRKFESILDHMGRVAGVMEAERQLSREEVKILTRYACLLYTSPSPRDLSTSRMPSSA